MILDFSDEHGKRHFEFCFIGFIVGGSMVEKKGMQLLRLEVGVFEKLESISDLKPNGAKLVNGEPDRILKNGNAPKQIHVSMEEYGLLVENIGRTPWQTGTPGRNAVEVLDWLEKTQKDSVK